MTRSQAAPIDPSLGPLEQIQLLTQAVDARDTFIAVAAHELRNPMMPIMGQIELLRASIAAGRCSMDALDERLAKLQRSVQQYMKRAVVLLDVSRLNSGKFQLEPSACDVAMVLREIGEQFAAAAQHAGVTLRIVAPESLPARLDRLALEQIIDNLLSNAIKYGGPSPVELTLSTVGAAVILQIRDHGKGVPVMDRERIFERFERAVGRHDHRTGFGVGLWIVGQLVEAMNGRIIVKDAPGGGALFEVNVPAYQGET